MSKKVFDFGKDEQGNFFLPPVLVEFPTLRCYSIRNSPVTYELLTIYCHYYCVEEILDRKFPNFCFRSKPLKMLIQFK